MPIQSLSVFFPMYNERPNIEALLDHVEAILPELGFDDYEILIINDGSRDGCDALVEQRAAINPRIRLVHHPRNLGYGAALRTGFTQANREWVFYTDCDLPADLRDIARAVPLTEQADLVVGYRIRRYETLRRAVFSRIYNLLMRLLFNVRVRDVNFSFKLARRSVIQRMRLTAGTVFIDGQLLAEAQRLGASIVEIPIQYTPRKNGESNFDRFSTAWATLIEMLRYWWSRPTGTQAGTSESELVED